MKFKLLHYETIRHNAGFGSDRNYGIILKWEGWDEVMIEINLSEPTLPDSTTGNSRDHYLLYSDGNDGILISGGETSIKTGVIHSNDLYFQTFIDDFEQKPEEHIAEYSKKYTIRIYNALDQSQFVEYEIIKYANSDTAPSNQGDIMRPRP